jgi:5-methylthioadenosine/S-adenosylhomocysteine deaminase
VTKLGGTDFPNIENWMAKGVRTGLGTDGVGSNNDLDMIEEMRFATLIRKMKAGDARALPACDILRVATLGGAEVLGLDQEIGSLKVGKKADLILINLHQPHLTPRHNLRGHLVYSAHGSDVATVIVNGRILYHQKQFTQADLEDILQKAQHTFEKMLTKAGWHLTMDEPEQGHIAALKQSMAKSAIKIFTKLINPDQE